MNTVVLSGRGYTIVPVLRVLRMSGLAKSRRAALNHWRFREVYVNGERMENENDVLMVDTPYRLEIRPLNGTPSRSLEVTVSQYPFHKFLKNNKIVG
jgi:tyrosyl-tRNA synthetase